MKQEEFKKAVKKKIRGNLIGILLSGPIAFMLWSLSFSIYSVDQDSSLLLGVFGIVFSIVLICSFIEIIYFMFNPKGLDYILCKRCKCLINKDKMFCQGCKNDIRRSLRRTEDKQYFKDYKKIIKQKEKKK